MTEKPYTDYTILKTGNLAVPSDHVALALPPSKGDIVLSEHDGIYRVLHLIHDSRRDVLEPNIFLVCEELSGDALPGFGPADDIRSSQAQ